jgi:phosphoglycolate phosphatase
MTKPLAVSTPSLGIDSHGHWDFIFGGRSRKHNRPMQYCHIVFDLDGTLIDSRADLAQAVNHVLRMLGLPSLPLDVVTSYIGAGARMLVQRSLGPQHEHRLDDGLRLFMEFYGAHLLDHTQLYPGITDLLSTLARRGVGLSVLSNKPEAMSRAILAHLGVLPLFAVVVGGDSVAARKPDPGGLQHLCVHLHMSPEQLLMVGDSVIDLDTARAAGIAFCGVAWGFGVAGLQARGTQPLIDEPAQLLGILAGDGRAIGTLEG